MTIPEPWCYVVGVLAFAGGGVLIWWVIKALIILEYASGLTLRIARNESKHLNLETRVEKLEVIARTCARPG